ncbi:MAG: C4-dicarboxylate transporter [Proteobacteria bacterium]|nr:C4-dicarboxylate transporter [Pseudomonadota bacterium]
MDRRRVIQGLGLGAVAAATAACAREKEAPAEQADTRTFNWRMATTWPPNFPALGTGANQLAEMIERCSAGRLKIKVYGANELVPAFEVFDAVSSGTAEMGHGAAYYWKGKIGSASFFSAVPFGLTTQEINGWFYYGGGLELWKEAYAPFGVIPMPGGNSGTQMGGWFRKEIKSVDDLKGLKMRIPGIAGEVLQRAGGTPVTLPGGEIFTALETGAIDATEWIGPYNDLAFGLYKAAKYYYYPGWHEPGTCLEAIINQKAFEGLPADLQEIVLTCCHAVNEMMNAEFLARNAEALQTLIRDHGVMLRRFPDDVLKTLRELSVQVIEEGAASDPFYARVHESVKAFQERSAAYLKVAEEAYLQARSA